MTRTFTCGMCHKTFETDTPIEEVLAEAKELFNIEDANPDTNPAMGSVCDDCFNGIPAEDRVMIKLIETHRTELLAAYRNADIHIVSQLLGVDIAAHVGLWETEDDQILMAIGDAYLLVTRDKEQTT